MGYPHRRFSLLKRGVARLGKPQLGNMDVSIVIPFLDAAATLPACLAGLQAQDDFDGEVEWIFVDNGSTDDSAKILRAHPRVRLLFESRPGAYAARNTGVAAATGGILAFIDPDCVPRQSWLRSLFEAMRQPGVGVTLGVRRPTPDTGLNRMLGDYDTTRDEWALTSEEPTKCYGYTNNMGVTRAAWDRHGPFDDRSRGSDTIFVRRVVDGEGCTALAFVPAMIVSHLEMDGVATYLRKVFTYGRSMQSYRRVIAVRPLTLADRLAVFRKTVHNECYGFLRASTLAVLLAVGLWAWAIGRLSGYVMRK